MLKDPTVSVGMILVIETESGGSDKKAGRAPFAVEAL